MSIAPFVVNSAFSIELYLKILAKVYNKPMKGHDALALFDALTADARKTIEATLPRCLNFGPAGNVDLRTCISDLANAFVDWRYLHEKRSTTTLHIDRMICDQSSG